MEAFRQGLRNGVSEAGIGGLEAEVWSKRQVGPLGPGVEGRKSPLFALGLEEFKSRRQITMRNPSGTGPGSGQAG